MIILEKILFCCSNNLTFALHLWNSKICHLQRETLYAIINYCYLNTVTKSTEQGNVNVTFKKREASCKSLYYLYYLYSNNVIKNTQQGNVNIMILCLAKVCYHHLFDLFTCFDQNIISKLDTICLLRL